MNSSQSDASARPVLADASGCEKDASSKLTRRVTIAEFSTDTHDELHDSLKLGSPLRFAALSIQVAASR